jgi:chromosome segregation ATPase
MTEETMPELPVEVNVPMPEQDRRKQVMLQAAAVYDAAEDERREMLRLIEQSKIALEVRNNQIDELKLALAEERNRHASLQHAYNDLIQDKADLEAILDNHQRDLENMASKLSRFEFSRVRRGKRNGKRAGQSMPDASGSADPLADISSLVAHGAKVLGQPEGGG